MSGSITKTLHPTRPSGPRRVLDRLKGRNTVGVNAAAGIADDDWRAPPPVTLADGSRVTLLKDGEALKVAYDAVAQAKHRICFEFYIWDDDDTGRAFAELLYKKARDGVRVYVTYDSFGVWPENDRSMFHRLRKAGAYVAEFHPIRPWETKYGWRPYSRDHRKLVVVDHEFAGVGGMNIANAYGGSWVADNELTPLQLWRDTGIGVQGPSTRLFLSAFAHMWNYIRNGGRIVRAMYSGGLNTPRSPKGFRVGKAKDTDPPPPRILESDSLGVLATVPTLASPLRPLLQDLLNSATKSIRLTMAYFAPDDELVKRLCEAAQRGVKVQLMFGAKSDLPIMVTAARAFYDVMFRAGIEIFERQFVVLHAKTLIVDDEIAIIGSTNLDYRSIELNCEISAVVRNMDFAAQLNLLFEHDLKYAKKIDPEAWRDRPFRDRFVQWTVSRMRYLL
jgi:cardiolipin synthase